MCVTLHFVSEDEISVIKMYETFQYSEVIEM